MNTLTRRLVGIALTTAVLTIGPVVGRSDATTTAPAVTAVPTAVNYGSGLWGGPGSIVRSGNPAATDVLVVGDSITARCYPRLRTALAAKGLTLSVVAQSGQNTKGLVTLLTDLPAVPKRVVMAAGTNDVFAPPAVAAQVGRALGWLSDVGATAYWVDTYVGRPATLAADARNSGWVNGQVYAAAPRVIGWQPALGAAVGRGRALSYYLQDGVHPWTTAGTGHADGCAFWAAVVAAGVK